MSQVSVLPFTGERYTPEGVREIFFEHLHRYAFARAMVGHKHVLDCACGEGYGSALLAQTAASVVGVDVDENSVRHAQARYAGPINLKFQHASASALPFDRASFDVVVSFETIEHLSEQAQMLAEFRRVLKPGGFLLLSSPDREAYNALGNGKNAFHVAELSKPELDAALKVQFPAVRYFGQKLLFQSVIWPEDGSSQARMRRIDADLVSEAQTPAVAPVYHLALAAASEACLPALDHVDWFGDVAESVNAHYQAEIRNGIFAARRIGELLAELHALKDTNALAEHRLKQFELTLVEARWRNYMGKRR